MREEKMKEVDKDYKRKQDVLRKKEEAARQEQEVLEQALAEIQSGDLSCVPLLQALAGGKSLAAAREIMENLPSSKKAGVNTCFIFLL